MEPKVSVIIPVYKTSKDTFIEAIESIRNQTYQNYEVLIIIDNETSDEYQKIIETFNDDRFVVLCNGCNKGLPYSLNRGIELSTGKYIIRMDSDDISLPDRIQEQVNYLEIHPEVDIVSAYAETFGRKHTVYSAYTKDNEIKAEMLWKNPITHPTVAFRKATIIDKKIRYTEGASEDYRMWLDMAYNYQCTFAIMPEILLKYRIHPGQVTQKDKTALIQKDREIFDHILELLNICMNDYDMDMMCKCRIGEHFTLREAMHVKRIMSNILRDVPKTVSKKVLRKCMIKSLIRTII